MLNELISDALAHYPTNTAIIHKNRSWSYQELSEIVSHQARALQSLNVTIHDRVAVYLPKQIETASSFFSISAAGAVFVPVNPVIKPAQVEHILADCNVKILITSIPRLKGLQQVLQNCPDLETVIVVEETCDPAVFELNKKILDWPEFLAGAKETTLPRITDTSMAAILYTSGSTGKPKGVVLSHLNIKNGAKSVSEYLKISQEDKLLAVLPFSFDYGLNQLISCIHQGACCVLFDYFLPRDVIKILSKEEITGLAAVPPLWAQLADLDWPESINQHLRYMTNSGGKMPKAILDNLRQKVPAVEFYLMYGLTEAFRSTYLPPDQVDIRPDSMGKAIPNAEILVVRKDGSLCDVHEPGELVHKGSLVALGYWNDPEKTAERFKPAPAQLKELPLTEIAVWSGDQVSRDDEGYLYFIGRQDDMLKTSGYRVSPTEIEEIVYSFEGVKEAAAIGIPHQTLGHKILVVITAENAGHLDVKQLMTFCKTEMANFMVPADIIVLDELPKNPNGKIDRKKLVSDYSESYQ